MSNSKPPLIPPPDPRLTPPDGKPGDNGPGGRRTPVLTVAGVLLLCIIAIGVVYWLPDMISTDRSGTGHFPAKPASHQGPERHPGPAAAPKGEGENDIFRQKAIAAQRIWLEKKARAELEGMGQWGGKRYAQAVALSRSGIDQLKGQDFTRAASSFRQAVSLIDDLDASKHELLEQALKAGSDALEHGLQKEAVQAFSTALAIDPQNGEARTGLRRAGTITMVHTMLRHAREQSEAGKPEATLKTAEAILKIDPLCTEARRLLKQAGNAIKRKKFDLAMGRAISALSAHRYSEAQGALSQAQALFPSDPSVRELSARIETARTSYALRSLLSQAGRAQKDEEWKRAISLYNRALAIDPLSVAAKQGIARCQRMRALEASLEKIINDPWNLNQQGPLSDARNTVKMAQAVDAPGPVLKRLTAKARQVLREWQQKVDVTLISDNMTDVVIYHLGRLGKFRQRTLRIRPGIYTVKGMREGYRDVRKEIRIRPGAGKLQVEVRCTEQI